MHILLLLICSLALFAQNPESSSWPPTAATDTDLLVLSNSAQTTLNGAINNSTLSVVLTSASAFTTPLAIRIDNEFLKVCSKSTNTLTICSGGRGFQNSTAASHSDGATVSAFFTAYNGNKMAAEIKALQAAGLWSTSACGTDNRLMRSDGTGRGVQCSGITVDDSDNVTIPGTLSVGSSPVTISGGSGGAFGFPEGTVPTTGAASAVDICYADSTAHAILCSFNNSAYSRLARHADSLSDFVQSVPSEAYDATGWNGDAGPPTKNDVRDYLESLFPSGVVTATLIPQGSSPTVNAAGKLGIDTTSGQFRIHDGAEKAIPTIQFMSFVIAAPATTDDINLMKAPYGMTILGIDAIVQGTTSVTGQLQECASDGTSCTDLDSDITADADGATDDGTLSDNTIASGAWIRWKTTSVSGTPTFLTVTVRYRVVPD